jgi:Glycosyl transferase family 2
VDVERDITVLVKAFERPEALKRLLASVRGLYERVPIVVVDDSAERLDPVPGEITTYLHEPYNSLGAAGGRNLGLRHVETPYVLVCDDDMVFERRTDLGRMLHALESTPFDVVSAVWLDFDPWKGICRGPRRFEGTLDIEDGVLVHRLGATRGTADGLPVFDVVHQFFVAALDRLGPDPWDPELNLSEHYELFLSLKERGLKSTRLPDVVVQHRQELPSAYQEVREDTRRYVDAWLAKRDLTGLRVEGELFRASDRVRYELPGAAAYTARRAARVGRRVLSERRLRAP